MKILVVEDENAVRDFIRAVLEDNGHEVVVAGDGLEGLEAIGYCGPFECVVTDVLMPIVNGWEFYQKLVAAGDQHVAKVIFMSGYASPELAERIRATNRPFLSKPFRIAELLGALGAIKKV